tara:strand:- start:95 stop:316 length:222 start_codon:yes stop_codon:yes gene_type:complete
MIKVIIIVCCELIIGSKSGKSYSYEAKYTDMDNYPITIYTRQKYNIGDTVEFFGAYSTIDWSDTTFFYGPLVD